MKQKSVGAQWIFIHFFKRCFIQGNSKGCYTVLFRKQFYSVIMDYAIMTCVVLSELLNFCYVIQ